MNLDLPLTIAELCLLSYRPGKESEDSGMFTKKTLEGRILIALVAKGGFEPPTSEYFRN